MALQTTTSKVVLSGNGATTVFPYSFQIPDAASLQVIFTDASGVQTTLSSSQFSVTGLGGTTGGNVTYPLFGVPIAAGTKLTISRIVDYTQSTVFTNQGGYFPAVTESRLDRVMMAIQQLADRVGRALAAPISDTVNPTDLPSATQRANTILAFDGSGNPFASVLTTGIVAVSAFISSTLFPAASAAAARTALGVTNANLGAIGAVRLQKFTGNGTYTPNANMLYCIIECWGAGGGGGGTATSAVSTACSAGAGGAGGRSRKLATAAQIGASQSVTIGAAGAAGVIGNNPGGAGGDTSLGALCVGKGGSGGGGSSGGAGTAGTGGAGGIAGTGDDVSPGQAGQSAVNLGNAGLIVSTAGGSGAMGAGAPGAPVTINQATVGAAGTGFGSGGGGGASTNNAGQAAGGAGTAGYVSIIEFCSS